MELEDLRSVWQQASDREAGKKALDAEQIKNLLGKQTRSIVDKIDLNIKISFGLILAMIVYFFLEQYILTPQFSTFVPVEIPKWVSISNAVSYVLVIAVFIYFWTCYRKIDTKSISTKNLKESLISLLKALHIFNKLFYFTLVIVLLLIGITFTAGMYMGIEYNMQEMEMELSTGKVLLMIGLGLAALSFFLWVFYSIYKWIFNRLYGRYLVQLEDTLKELNETE